MPSQHVGWMCRVWRNKEVQCKAIGFSYRVVLSEPWGVMVTVKSKKFSESDLSVNSQVR